MWYTVGMVNRVRVKTSITIDADSLTLWDALAKERGLNRSAFLSMLLRDEAERRNVKIEPKTKTRKTTK